MNSGPEPGRLPSDHGHPAAPVHGQARTSGHLADDLARRGDAAAPARFRRPSGIRRDRRRAEGDLAVFPPRPGRGRGRGADRPCVRRVGPAQGRTRVRQHHPPPGRGRDDGRARRSLTDRDRAPVFDHRLLGRIPGDLAADRPAARAAWVPLPVRGCRPGQGHVSPGLSASMAPGRSSRPPSVRTTTTPSASPCAGSSTTWPITPSIRLVSSPCGDGRRVAAGGALSVGWPLRPTATSGTGAAWRHLDLARPLPAVGAAG